MSPIFANRVAAIAVATVLAVACPAGGWGKDTTDMKNSGTSGTQGSVTQVVSDLVLYAKGTVGFREKAIPSDTLKSILEAVTPYVSLSNWRLIAIQKRESRVGLLESMQATYRKLDKQRWANTMERWKPAPLILVFCAPNETQDFGGVPSDIMRPMTLIEMGVAVQSLILIARAYGIETHWIASALLIQQSIKEELGIPDDYGVVFFGVAGYPSEEANQDFAQMRDVCFAGSWGVPFQR